MDDLTGLGKLANSQLANDLYQDVGSKAAEQLGRSLEDTAKAFRLFTFPLQLLAIAQDRLADFCERVRQSVPEERHIEAAPSIAGPVLLELRFMEETSPITKMYLNLLSRAIDRDRKEEAHPAFVKIIGQLSPDEALLLHHLSKNTIQVDCFLDKSKHKMLYDEIVSTDYDMELIRSFDLLAIAIRRLNDLGLVFRNYDYESFDYDNSSVDVKISLSPFGRLFTNACNP